MKSFHGKIVSLKWCHNPAGHRTSTHKGRLYKVKSKESSKGASLMIEQRVQVTIYLQIQSLSRYKKQHQQAASATPKPTGSEQLNSAADVGTFQRYWRQSSLNSLFFLMNQT